MTNKKTSFVYPLVSISAIIVFILAIIGLLIPLVEISGKSYNIFQFLSDGIEQFENFNSKTFGLCITNIIIDFSIFIHAVVLFIIFVVRFINYLIKNRKVFLKSFNDFYADDLVKVSTSFGIFILLMFAYFGSEWKFGIGLILILVASLIALGAVVLLRIYEICTCGSGKVVAHNILLLLAGIVSYVALVLGLMKFVVNGFGTGETVARNTLVNLFSSFGSDKPIGPYILEVSALILIMLGLDRFQNLVFCGLDCLPRTRRQRREHERRDAHVRGIVHSALALIFIVGGMIIMILNYEEAYGYAVTAGSTGIFSIAAAAICLVLFIIARVIKPEGLKLRGDMTEEEIETMAEKKKKAKASDDELIVDRDRRLRESSK